MGYCLHNKIDHVTHVCKLRGKSHGITNLLTNNGPVVMTLSKVAFNISSLVRALSYDIDDLATKFSNHIKSEYLWKLLFW